MPTMRGRRISARTRYRAGDLMRDDGTLADAVDPSDPGTDDTSTDTGTIGIDVDASLTL